MKFKPIVSIIVPNYNHSKYLEQRIQTILMQTYENYEIILMDDCSTDNSADILKKFQSNLKVSKLIINEANSGTPFGLWEKGIEAANGKYIWIAESDDWSDSKFLEILVEQLEKSDAVVAHCNSYIANGINIYLNNWWNSFKINKWEHSYIEEGIKLLNLYGKYKCPIINVSSAIFKKEVLKTEFFPNQYRFCGDWWFWIQLFNIGKVAYVPYPMNFVRLHNESTTGSDIYSIDKLKENVLIINELSKTLKEKLVFSEQYDWVIDMWLNVIIEKNKYYSLRYHNIDLPISFKYIFYKRLFILILRKLKFKLIK